MKKKRGNQNWFRKQKHGDVNFLLICGVLQKEIDEEHAGEHCIYIHYILNKDKYIGYLSFQSEIERDLFYLNDVTDEVLEQVAIIAITNDVENVKL